MLVPALCFYSCPPPQGALDEGCGSGSVGSCGGKGRKPGVGVGASDRAVVPAATQVSVAAGCSR
jgi:hypothetical protein